MADHLVTGIFNGALIVRVHEGSIKLQGVRRLTAL
jgi:hypothetical protein